MTKWSSSATLSFTACEHHMLPFIGRFMSLHAGRKSDRQIPLFLVDLYARRLQVRKDDADR
jgi:GTP cyclohydrolase I